MFANFTNIWSSQQKTRYMVSDMVHAPFPSNDHVTLMSCLSEAGHLHHTQACVQVAFSMPQTTAKKFKSPHRKYSMGNLIPSMLINVNVCTSFRILLKAISRSLYFSVEFITAIV